MGSASRSWTDAITNSALLAQFDTAQYLKWVEKRTVKINNIIPQFLHEGTHHWCFHSVAGNAIALLTMRARRNSLIYGPKKRFDDIKADLLRAQTAEIMLQPFSEGLALFAEFDATPGKSSISSQTMLSCLMCFGFQGKTLDDIQTPLVALLQNTRRQPEFLRRKAGIYAHTFECEEGYLSGYLSVKALWAALATRVSAFNDRDLFLSFMRSYIYGDPNLVLVMLSEEADDGRPCEAIANYILQRFASLVERDDLAEKVAEWEEACAQERSVWNALGASEEQGLKAEEQLLSLVSDVHDKEPASRFATHAFATLQERQYLTLGSLKATATAKRQKTQIVCVDDPDVRYEQDMDLADGTHEGNLIVVLPSSARYLLVLLVSGKRCHVVRSFGDVEQANMERVSRYAINQALSTSVHENLEQALERALAHPMLRTAFDHNKSNCLRSADLVYGILATLHAKEDAVDDVLDLLRAGGLLALLDNDVGLVRGIAAIGLANTVASDIPTMKMLARLMGLDEQLIDRTIRDAVERHGMRLLAQKPGAAIAMA